MERQMRRRLWPRLAIGAIIGLLLALGVIMLADPNRAQTIIDPNTDRAVYVALVHINSIEALQTA